MTTTKPERAAQGNPGETAVGDAYRRQWTWDATYWASHCVDCYPGSCPYRVFVKDGRVAFEEAAGSQDVVVDGVPDRNPMGCQKGAAWSRTLYGQERVLHPLRREGERGEGRWKRVSWDEALTDIADRLLDAIQESGPESLVHEMTPAEGGTMAIWPVRRLLVELLGGVSTDVNAVINDLQPGHYITWGKNSLVATLESQWYTKLRLIWHNNPVYTTIPTYHFGPETRYQGCEVIHFAPDCGPSHIHADYFFSVRPGTDAALALGMCQTIIEENLLDREFVLTQTDLPLLIRLDTKRFLRESDLKQGGSDEQFYAWNARQRRLARAPRETLSWGAVDPDLTGDHPVRLKSGKTIHVAPAFAVLKQRLDDEYTPEQASQICGVNAEVIRSVGRKVASLRTHIGLGGMGYNSGKCYHGDLMQRAMLLLLGLTGNWGRHGGGMGAWAPGSFDGPGIFSAKQRPGMEETRRILAQRASLAELARQTRGNRTEEIAAIDGAVQATRGGLGNTVPPAFFWYYHCGYRERWNQASWGDPAMRRSFDEYLEEAIDKGWWGGVLKPAPEQEPRVLFEVGGNMLRRQRGGRTQLLQTLWPKLNLIVSVDWRMSTTGMFSDYVLPCAQHYEKPNFHLAGPLLLRLTYSDNATEPEGESLSEWDIFRLLARKLEERARERDFLEYTDSIGRPYRLDDLYYSLTLGIEDLDELVDEWIKDTAAAGRIAEGESLETVRARGHAEFTGVGQSVIDLNQATDLEPGEPFTPLRWHVEKKLPYPTLTRRAQFYIDHPWFMEAGEELPVHKETPAMGGDYPLVMTSGHCRWSIHSMHITNRMLLQTHRGRPHMVMSPLDAEARGVSDGEEVRVYNDCGSFLVPVKLSPSVRPGQVIVYNGWDPYQFRGWMGPMDVEPGMVKWLHMAGGYGHLRYWPLQWQPIPVDRAIRVEVEMTEGS